jgi:hypothetical protein
MHPKIGLVESLITNKNTPFLGFFWTFGPEFEADVVGRSFSAVSSIT